MNNYKITVITVSYNAEKLIEATMRSVLDQTYSNVEYIIQDGLSTDNTINIANKLKNEYEEREVIIFSEVDSGIFDAMNKAVEKASGDWVIFMNCGDVFYNRTTISCVFEGKDYSNIDGVYGDTIHKRGNMYKHLYGKPLEAISRGFGYRMPFCHQSVFVRTELQKEIPFNVSNKLAGDFDFFYTMYDKKMVFDYCGIIISIYLREGFGTQNQMEDIKTKIKYREKHSNIKLNPFSRFLVMGYQYYIIFVRKVLPENLRNILRGYSYNKE